MQVSCLVVFALLLLACSRQNSPVEVLGPRWIFMSADMHRLPSGEYVVAIDLTPEEEPDGEKMCKLLRSGHRVLFRLREEPDRPPILITAVTDRAEAIILCNTLDEAQHVIDRLHARPRD